MKHAGRTTKSARRSKKVRYAVVGQGYISQAAVLRKQTFAKRDQFAAELIYFSKCVLEGKEPEPSGREGLADVRVIRALYRSAHSGRPVTLRAMKAGRQPSAN